MKQPAIKTTDRRTWYQMEYILERKSMPQFTQFDHRSHLEVAFRFVSMPIRFHELFIAHCSFYHR